MTSTRKQGPSNGNQQLLETLTHELARLDARDVQLKLDDEFEPKAGTLLKVEIGPSYWHILPEEFRTILGDLSDGVRSDAIRKAIEQSAMRVWHGPAPKSRDTSP